MARRLSPIILSPEPSELRTKRIERELSANYAHIVRLTWDRDHNPQTNGPARNQKTWDITKLLLRNMHLKNLLAQPIQ